MSEKPGTNELDRWIAVLQQALYEQAQLIFSATVLAEARQPHNMTVLDDVDGYGLASSSCGDSMEVFLKLDGERVALASFMTDGCTPTVACGSMLTRLATGHTLAEAAAIEAAELVVALDGLPPENIHCATLAVDALCQAIANCRAGHRHLGGA